VFLVIVGTAISALLSYGLYIKYVSKQSDDSTSGVSTQESAKERARQLINKEMRRLQNPKIIEVWPYGEILQKKDFFDLLFLIQL
jgi:type II secretory pathway component PulJ